MAPRLHVLRCVEGRGLGLGDDLVGLVAVDQPRAFVRQQDRAVQTLADDRVLARGLEDVRIRSTASSDLATRAASKSVLAMDASL
jgi:hypothetical protein